MLQSHLSKIINKFIQLQMQARTYLLTENDQNKITYLITNFAKSEPNLLKYSETIALLLDRCVFNTRFTLVHFHGLFQQALLVKPPKPNEKTEVQGQKVLTKEQLIFLLNQTAKLLYKPDPNYLERFYTNFLSEKMQIQNGQINRSRVMVIDDLAKKLLVEEIVQQLCMYSEELKHLFICYSIENYWSIKKNRRLLLSFREILLQNKKWSFYSLVLFLKESETAPHLTTVEHVEQYLRMIVPGINQKQQEFYSRHYISDAYHKDHDGSDGKVVPGDPGMMFFEVQLLILRLAWECYPKDLEKKNLGMVLQRYIKYLYLRKDEEMGTVGLPDISRKMIGKMKEYYKIINNQVRTEGQKPDSSAIPLTPFEQLANKMKKELIDAPPVDIDFREMFKVLDRELPKMPPMPVVEPEYTGKYDKNFATTIGQQPPPEPVQKNDKPKAEKKNDKKDQVPLRTFKWADEPQYKMATEDYMKKIDAKLNFQVKPLGDLSRGTINKEGYPVLIGQIVFPPELPKSVVHFLDEVNNAIADRNFILALDNLTLATNAWKKTSVQFDAVAELFFTYFRGNIYLTAGKIQQALNIFYTCRRLVDTSKIPFNNPDRSLPYFGMGEVFYQMQQYQAAARSFLKAREIRQSVLGLQHVQTATVFNNLACCFFMLRRSQQSLGYVQIAQAVLDTELGAHHERTMTSRSNFKKISRGTFDNQPAFRKFWEVFEEDKFEKKKKKKKGDDGGKKGKK